MNKKEWNKLLQKVAEQIHAGEQTGIINPAMVRMHAQELLAAITQGYGANIEQKDLEAERYETLYQLQTNMYHFSGAKNWQQIQEMTLLLTDKEGSTLPFDKYLQAVKTIDKTYNETYLKAEYENAVTSAQMASKWQKFKDEAEVLPNLRWVTAAGEHTCELCSALSDITLPFKHPFWQTTFVPRHFKCKCTIAQEDEFAELTDLGTRKIPATHPMFENNVGISGVAFNDKHSYFRTMPQKVKENVFIASEKLMPKKRK